MRYAGLRERFGMPRTALCFLLSAIAITGEQFPYRTLTTADGLVRNTITRIRRDPKGYLWICTVEGLSLFDGQRFINYTVADGLPDQRVNDLLPAGDDSYWLATGAGLYRFQPRRALSPNQNPKPIFAPVPRSGAEVLGNVAALIEDRHGTLWAGAKTGLYMLRAKSTALERVPLQPPSTLIETIYQDLSQRIWIGTELGLYRYSEQSGAAVMVRKERDARAIIMDRPGSLWIGAWGLTHLNVARDPPAVLEHLGPRDSSVLADRVFGLAQSPDGDLWMAANGLARFRPSLPSGVGRIRTVEVSSEWEQFANAIEVDSSNVWAGVGRMGLIAISQTGWIGYTGADGLSTTKASGVVAGDRPLVITSTDRILWNEFDGTRFFSIQPGVPKSIQGMGWGIGSVVQQTPDGSWWQASQGGLLHYPAATDLKRLAGVLPTEVITERDGLPGRIILQLFADSHGTLWVGTLNGLGWRDPSTGKWQSHSTPNLRAGVPAVESIAEDHTGTIWFSTHNQGLTRFRHGRFEPIAGGVSKRINGLFVDSRGRLWIASSREGLGRIDHPQAESPQVRLYGTKDGLSSADSFSVSEDLDGRIYVGGGQGVDRLNLETGQIRHFTAVDGLQGEPEKLVRDRSGALWSATASGVYRYVPSADESTPPPQPLFHSVRISGQQYLVSDLGESSVANLELDPGETGLDVEVGSVRLGSGEKIRYQYRLDGDNGTWSIPRDGPLISLAGLSSGSYRLEVRSIDGSGLMSQESGFVRFRMTPHFWQLWWVRLLAILAVLMAAIAFHRIRLNAVLELERVRSRIAADLHDDIGASLSQVAVLSEVVHRRAHDPATVQKHTEKIAVICRELVDSAGDIVWAVSPNHDSFMGLTQRMREFAGELLPGAGIQFRFEVTDQPRLRLGADLRRQVYLIFKEAVNNAARHSGATFAEILLTVEGPWLVLKVDDNGRGLPDANDSRTGNGLANMRRRAEVLKGHFQITKAPSGGASLRVRLPL